MTCNVLEDFISSMTVVLSNTYYKLGSVSIEKSTNLLTGLFVCTFRRRRKLYQYSVSNNRIKCWAHFNNAIIRMDCAQVSADEMKSARSC